MTAPPLPRRGRTTEPLPAAPLMRPRATPLEAPVSAAGPEVAGRPNLFGPRAGVVTK